MCQDVPPCEPGRGDRGVERVDRPQRTAVSGSRERVDHVLGVPAGARSRPANRAEAGEGSLRLGDVTNELLVWQPDPGAVPGSMVAKLVALPHHPLHGCFVSGDLRGNQKEGGMG